MKVILLLLFLGSVFAIGPQIYSLNDAKSLFNNFVIKYNKVYLSYTEYSNRFIIFKENLAIMNEMNSKETSAIYGITKYSDLSPSEFKAKYLTHKRNSNTPLNYINIPTSSDIPQSFDWRDKGAVTPVKDQGQCGSCWAFSATEAIESQWFLAGHTLTSLAPQQIVDCDQGRGDEGCEGGDTPTAYEYVISAGGMETETEYPYTAEDQTCQFKSSDVVAKISNWTYITTTKNETEMMVKIISTAPYSICVDASSWQFYLGGVVQDFCGTDLDHCVMITGFEDYETWDFQTLPIWLIRNSWGEDWGENGYIYVERNYDLCGVADEVTIPLV